MAGVEDAVSESVSVISSLSTADIESGARLLAGCLKSGRKVLLCGNGGSAADCQHVAGELVGRFKMERDALPAISLTTDTSILTALANDFGVESIFERQVRALGAEGDVLVAFSTSGASPNVIAAVETARELGLHVLGFTGQSGKKLASLCDVCVVAQSNDTPRIQEAHIVAAHIICQLVEAGIFGK